MRFRIILSSLSLFLFITPYLSAQDSSVSTPETESISSQVAEKTAIEDISDKEQSEDSTVTEEMIVDTSGNKKTDDVEESIVTVGEENVEDRDSLKTDEDTVLEKTIEEIDDMDIVIEEDVDLFLIEDDEDELLITDDTEEDILAEEDTAELKKDIIDTEAISPEKKGEEIEKEDVISKPEDSKAKEIDIVEEEVVIEEEEEIEKAIVIKETKSINFAKSLKEYRSPRKAMFMSLLLPGLGQAYTKKYWKTAMFGVIEVALITFSIKYAIDGRDKKEDARDFADTTFSIDNFFTFYENFEEFVSPESINVEDVAMTIGDSLSNYKKKYTPENIADHESDARHDYDSDIGREWFVQGWKDCEPYFTNDGYLLEDTSYTYTYSHYTSDTTWLVSMYNKGDTAVPIETGLFGYSANQRKYNHMIYMSNQYYNVSTYLIITLVANHLISAIDAFISARAYNQKLLNKKSVWQNIYLEQQIAFTETGIQSRFGIKVRF